VIGLAVVIGLPLVILAGYVFVAFASLPPLGGVAPEANQRALVVEAESGRAFATRGAFQGERLTEKTLPPRLAQAIVAIEDRRFYSHWGIDLRGMARAVWRNATGGGARAARPSPSNMPGSPRSPRRRRSSARSRRPSWRCAWRAR
jgi:membrane peptidoglycan carboxypeptidase